jgi:hypothetical protein
MLGRQSRPLRQPVLPLRRNVPRWTMHEPLRGWRAELRGIGHRLRPGVQGCPRVRALRAASAMRRRRGLPELRLPRDRAGGREGVRRMRRRRAVPALQHGPAAHSKQKFSMQRRRFRLPPGPSVLHRGFRVPEQRAVRLRHVPSGRRLSAGASLRRTGPLLRVLRGRGLRRQAQRSLLRRQRLQGVRQGRGLPERGRRVHPQRLPGAGDLSRRARSVHARIRRRHALRQRVPLPHDDRERDAVRFNAGGRLPCSVGVRQPGGMRISLRERGVLRTGHWQLLRLFVLRPPVRLTRATAAKWIPLRRPAASLSASGMGRAERPA